MSQISVSNLTFAYDGSYDNIFEDVSFSIDTDWKLGFTGRNGRGKTTFLKLLTGKYEYRGTISASVGFEYFPFEVADPSRDTLDVLESVADGFEFWELRRELSMLGVDEDTLYRPFSSLSGGERTKALLAGLFLKRNNFLLIDEPTNHLDAEAREAVGDYLNSKKGFILVSHDRSFLDRCVDHILSINKTDIEIQKGNFSSWWREKRRKDEYELAENEKLQKDMKKLSEAAKRAAAWSDKTEAGKYGTRNSGIRVDRGFVGHKSAKMMKRAKSIETRREDAAAQKSKLLKNLETADELSIKPLIYHTELLAELEGISINYGGKTVCENVSFKVKRGDRIALTGRNGSGKSSVLKLFAGGTSPGGHAGEGMEFTGNLRVGSGLIVSHVPQDASFLSGSLRDFAEENRIDESLFKAILRKLDFSRVQFEKNMSDFSGGQKKKVLIAKSLCQRAHLYIWDEPLNFIDVLSRVQIEDLILAHNPAMLFVEHDAAFTGNVSTGIVRLL